MTRKLGLASVLVDSLFVASEAAAIGIPATDFDDWLSSGSAGVLLASNSDAFETSDDSIIGTLDNAVYFNETTENYTYAHTVSPAVIQNVSEFNTGFAVNGFAGTAGFSFGASGAAGGSGDATDFSVQFEGDGTFDWETRFEDPVTSDPGDGWDSPEVMTFFFVSTNPPSPTLLNYRIINSEAGTAQSFGPGTAPIPEPGSIALLGSGLVGLYAAMRRRRNLKA